VSRYLTCAETAKLVRAALRAEFPGVKFSVRSSTYAGGASIDVSWIDGPQWDAVQAVCGLYEGASFDAMQDLKSYHSSILSTPDGAEEVRFGADFVQAHRRLSPQFQEDCAAIACAGLGVDGERLYGTRAERFHAIDGVDGCAALRGAYWGSDVARNLAGQLTPEHARDLARRLAADAAYDRDDRAWFYAQPTETLAALWALCCDVATMPAWDDEVYDALAARGHFEVGS
jgi:hypothetical protein